MYDLINRPRRLRRSPAMRNLVAEARLDKNMLVQPHFVVPGTGISHEIGAMPGISHQSIDKLVGTVGRDLELGIRSALLFGVPDADVKSPDGHGAATEDNLVSQAVSALKQRFGHDLLVMTDVCLCAYTDHGHCGLIVDDRIDNDSSLPHLAAMALAHAQAGADVVAPSDMMDGRVGAIREVLDLEIVRRDQRFDYQRVKTTPDVIEQEPEPCHVFDQVSKRLPRELRAAPFHAELNAIGSELDQVAAQGVVVLQITELLALLHFVEWRLGDVEVSLVDELWHLAVEESQQQGSDVGTVDIRVRHDDDLVVA